MSKRKKIIILAFLGIILLGSLSFFIFKKVQNNQAKNQTQEEEIKIATRDKASDIAKSFLKKQNYDKDYDIDSIKVENFTDFWSVWFDKKDKNARPNKGLIQVDKKTGEAKWKELQ